MFYKNNIMNCYINKLISLERASKNYNISKTYFQYAFNRQAYGNHFQIVDLSKISYQKRYDTRQKAHILQFMIGDICTVEEVLYYGIEGSGYITVLTANKCKLSAESVEAAFRVMVIMLLGFQCINRRETDGVINYRQFNQYLDRISARFCVTEHMEYTEFLSRFFMQASNTEENETAIQHIDYGQVNLRDGQIYGLKIKNTNILISEIMLSLLDYTIYLEVKKENQISYEEYRQVCVLLYSLLKGYECQKL